MRLPGHLPIPGDGHNRTARPVLGDEEGGPAGGGDHDDGGGHGLEGGLHGSDGRRVSVVRGGQDLGGRGKGSLKRGGAGSQ